MLWQNGGTAILNKAEEIAKDVLAVDAARVDRDAVWPENGLIVSSLFAQCRTRETMSYP